MAAKILMILLGLTLVLALACSGAAPPPPTSAPTPGVPVVESGPTPTSAPAPVSPPTHAIAAETKLTLVVMNESPSQNVLDPGCSSDLDSYACTYYASDTLVTIDAETFELKPLSGTEKWEQIGPDRWRFFLREGVKFHNGEPWNAQAAKFSIDITGDPANGLNSYTYTGPVSAEVMDDLTVDVVCEGPCPIFPRTSIFQRFQAPAWYQAATEAERASSTIGFGPYKYVEWRPGESIELQAYEDYLPNPASRESQAPIIKDLTQVYRSEALVRATMVKTGEADFAFEIGLENIPAVPQHQVGGTAEVLILQFDTIWHPELKKQKVRQAITHAIDCPAIVRTLYEDTTVCRGNASSPGTLGITDKNASPYKYDPELARRLLQEAEYDPANRIDIIVRIGRLYRGEELGEATVGYLREVGINAELKLVERSVWQEISRTGCGQYKEKALDCMNQPPGPPTHGSSQAYFNAPGNEILDYVRLARSHMDCFRTNAHYCDPQRVQPLLEQAAAASGDERRKLLEELADIHYNEVVVLPFFDLTIVYGLSEDLVFTPRYDRVVRANMLYFAR